MKTYNVRTSKPAPSMNKDKKVFEAENYQMAVAIAQSEWEKVGRRVSLFSDEYGMTRWHTISLTGLATDYNTNSEVPEQEQLYR